MFLSLLLLTTIHHFCHQNNKYLPPNDLFNPVNYGLNSKLVVAPFFRSITIYQLNRKIFTSYKLVNPLLASWDHDRLDQTAGSKLSESKMNVNYEAVFYGVGKVVHLTNLNL